MVRLGTFMDVCRAWLNGDPVHVVDPKSPVNPVVAETRHGEGIGIPLDADADTPLIMMHPNGDVLLPRGEIERVISRTAAEGRYAGRHLKTMLSYPDERNDDEGSESKR